MECLNHSGIEATATCTGCAEPFCDNCVLVHEGAAYCANCKQMAIAKALPPVLAESRDAIDALKFAIIGIFCFGIILEPIAISKALNARKAIRMDPTLGGKGKTTAALLIATAALALWVLGIVQRVSGR